MADEQRLGITESTVKAKPNDAKIVREGDRIPTLLSGRPFGAYVLSDASPSPSVRGRPAGFTAGRSALLPPSA
jgi:hypothetical protein